MKNKITNIAGILGLIGLACNIYTNGGIDVSDFLLLGASIGLFASYRKKTVDSDRENPDERDLDYNTHKF